MATPSRGMSTDAHARFLFRLAVVATEPCHPAFIREQMTDRLREQVADAPPEVRSRVFDAVRALETAGLNAGGGVLV